MADGVLWVAWQLVWMTESLKYLKGSILGASGCKTNDRHSDIRIVNAEEKELDENKHPPVEGGG